jgi:hypothetical protein
MYLFPYPTLKTFPRVTTIERVSESLLACWIRDVAET